MKLPQQVRSQVQLGNEGKNATFELYREVSYDKPVIKASVTKTPPDVHIGKLKTFGELGPYYELMGIGYQGEDGEWMVPIRAVESGEELDYHYSHLASDPDAS